MLIQPNSTIGQKVVASWVNIVIVVTVSLPLLWMDDFNEWRMDVVALFFAYNVVFALVRDPGMVFVGSYYQTGKCNTLPYIVLYTAGFATLFYWILFPGDLLLLNGIGQVICLRLTGNTLHGFLGGVRTLNIAGHINEQGGRII